MLESLAKKQKLLLLLHFLLLISYNNSQGIERNHQPEQKEYDGSIPKTNLRVLSAFDKNDAKKLSTDIAKNNASDIMIDEEAMKFEQSLNERRLDLGKLRLALKEALNLISLKGEQNLYKNNDNLPAQNNSLLTEQESKLYRISKIVENSLNSVYDKNLLQDLKKFNGKIDLAQEEIKWCFLEPWYESAWEDFLHFFGAKKNCVERPTKQEIIKNIKLEKKLKQKEAKDKKGMNQTMAEANKEKKASNKLYKLYKKDGDHLYNNAVHDRHKYLRQKNKVNGEKNGVNSDKRKVSNIKKKIANEKQLYNILYPKHPFSYVAKKNNKKIKNAKSLSRMKKNGKSEEEKKSGKKVDKKINSVVKDLEHDIKKSEEKLGVIPKKKGASQKKISSSSPSEIPKKKAANPKKISNPNSGAIPKKKSVSPKNIPSSSPNSGEIPKKKGTSPKIISSSSSSPGSSSN